jgi:hypothetical protein
MSPVSIFLTFFHDAVRPDDILRSLGKHTDNILPSVEQDKNLRKAKKTPDHEFMKKLKPYLIR